MTDEFASPAVQTARDRDTQLAIWNALKLFASFGVTWSVSLGARFLLPRFLGPDVFGAYNFADALAGSVFVLLQLGIDTYAQKELAEAPSRAGDFFGSVLVIRIVFAALLMTGVAALLLREHRPEAVILAALAFSAGQFFFTTNSTLAAFLQARGTVDGLAVVNVGSKLLWGGALLAAFFLFHHIAALAAAFTLAELCRSVMLYALCRSKLGLRCRLDVAATARVLRASLPYFLTTVSVTLFARLDDTLMGFFASDREVGWYGLASNLSQLALIFTPLMGAVFLPLFSRARARSEEELDALLRRSLELVLVITVPLTALLGLGADVWVRWVGGDAYGPSAAALRILAPVLVLSYVGIVSAHCLYLLGRSWRVTAICLVGLVINATLNVLLIGPLVHMRAGGGGIAASCATAGSELFVTSCFLVQIGRRIFDRRLWMTVGALAFVALATLLVHLALGRLGPLRLIVDGLLFGVLALVFGAVRPAELRAFLRLASSRSTRGPA